MFSATKNYLIRPFYMKKEYTEYTVKSYRSLSTTFLSKLINFILNVYLLNKHWGEKERNTCIVHSNHRLFFWNRITLVPVTIMLTENSQSWFEIIKYFTPTDLQTLHRPNIWTISFNNDKSLNKSLLLFERSCRHHQPPLCLIFHSKTS